jgi:hypothetical protein
MKRDLLIGTSFAIGIGLITYILSKKHRTAPAPNVQIDPSVYTQSTIYKIPNPKYKHPDQPVAESVFNSEIKHDSYKAPYDIFGFGLDSARNSDSVDPDSYLNMPLESDGKTYDTRDKYQLVEEEPEVIDKKFKYIRFSVLSVRDNNQVGVSIGGIRFLNKNISINNISLWNPHTGDKSEYNNDEWTDYDQHTAIFVFSEPEIITEYQLKTSMKTPDMDPIKWKLEASNNASYWTEIHKVRSLLSFDRNVVTTFSLAPSSN